MNKKSKHFLTEAQIEAGKLKDMQSLKGNMIAWKAIGLAIAYALIAIGHNLLGEKDE